MNTLKALFWMIVGAVIMHILMVNGFVDANTPTDVLEVLKQHNPLKEQ